MVQRPTSAAGTPSRASWASSPAPMSTAGVPHDVSANDSGTAAATSARIASGTS